MDGEMNEGHLNENSKFEIISTFSPLEKLRDFSNRNEIKLRYSQPSPCLPLYILYC